MNNPVARIVDANCNRAGEALRTIEEYARFVLESPGWAGRVKGFRHRLTDLARRYACSLAAEDLPLFHRDIQGDVGADIKTSQETSRGHASDVAAAAFARAEQALRALGEYAKLDNAEAAAGFEDLRYQVYALEPLMLAEQHLRRRLAEAKLYVLITGELCSAPPLEAARQAVAGGADVIQMREKTMEDGEFYRLASDMAEICRAGGAIFLINDRPHIASLVAADGIHGGQGDLPVHLARRLLGPDKIIGVSTSRPELAEKALADGADYIGVGPVFETNTKKHRQAAGLEYVTWASGWGGLPYFAIGAVNRDSIDRVVAAGARSVAICTAITKAADIEGETKFFKRRMLDAVGTEGR